MYALLFLALIPSAPAPRESPKDLDKLQGIWKVTAMESRGILRPVAVGNAGQARAIVIAGDAFAWTTVAGTLKIDSKKKTVDLVVTEGRYKGEVIPGLYELSGNTLKLAVPSPLVRLGNVRTAERPAELKTGPETRHSLYTFERDVTATKAEAAAKLKERKENVARRARLDFLVGDRLGGSLVVEDLLEGPTRNFDKSFGKSSSGLTASRNVWTSWRRAKKRRRRRRSNPTEGKPTRRALGRVQSGQEGSVPLRFLPLLPYAFHMNSLSNPISFFMEG